MKAYDISNEKETIKLFDSKPSQDLDKIQFTENEMNNF